MSTDTGNVRLVTDWMYRLVVASRVLQPTETKFLLWYQCLWSPTIDEISDIDRQKDMQDGCYQTGSSWISRSTSDGVEIPTVHLCHRGRPVQRIRNRHLLAYLLIACRMRDITASGLTVNSASCISGVGGLRRVSALGSRCFALSDTEKRKLPFESCVQRRIKVAGGAHRIGWAKKRPIIYHSLFDTLIRFASL